MLLSFIPGSVFYQPGGFSNCFVFPLLVLHLQELAPLKTFTRILKKEPLSYTFVEPDKRVVQSLGRLAQAAEDNGIGSRIIRAEPLDYDFHKLHFSKARRSMVGTTSRNPHHSDIIFKVPEKEALLPIDSDQTDTVVIANIPGWCYKTFLKKLAADLEEREGLFRAGPVKMYINVVGLVAGSQIGLLDRYSKAGFKSRTLVDG